MNIISIDVSKQHDLNSALVGQNISNQTKNQINDTESEDNSNENFAEWRDLVRKRMVRTVKQVLKERFKKLCADIFDMNIFNLSLEQFEFLAEDFTW